MFSLRQKREIADKIQKILKETKHPELPEGEITFSLHVKGALSWSWADIRNNGSVTNPGINPWNEQQAVEAKNIAQAKRDNCKHDYSRRVNENLGNCYNKETCLGCGKTWVIDSSD